MDRRDFIRLAGTASAGLAFPAAFNEASAQMTYGGAPAAWKMYEVTTRVQIMRPAGITRVWLPTPLTRDTSYHRSMGNWWQADDGTAAQAVDPHYGAGMVWAEFHEGASATMTLTSRFMTREIAVDLSKPGSARPENPAVLALYTQASEHMPTDGAVKELAMSIVKGAGNDVEKARALYDWVCENTARDPKTRGCGAGDVKFMVENQAYTGKCADLNALYVALARSVGLPARDVYGVRVAGSAYGYKSLGKAGGDITKAQHCRAEVYLQSHGWVPVDPADVRKVILEEDGGKAPGDPMVLAARKRLFGSWEMNWLPLNTANDLRLPGSGKGPVTFFMYPQGETLDGRIDSLDPDHFKYTIAAKELA